MHTFAIHSQFYNCIKLWPKHRLHRWVWEKIGSHVPSPVRFWCITFTVENSSPKFGILWLFWKWTILGEANNCPNVHPECKLQCLIIMQGGQCMYWSHFAAIFPNFRLKMAFFSKNVWPDWAKFRHLGKRLLPSLHTHVGTYICNDKIWYFFLSKFKQISYDLSKITPIFTFKVPSALLIKKFTNNFMWTILDTQLPPYTSS
jgi:hypothetical protein